MAHSFVRLWATANRSFRNTGNAVSAANRLALLVPASAPSSHPFLYIFLGHLFSRSLSSFALSAAGGVKFLVVSRLHRFSFCWAAPRSI